jgi:hypothetical protein
MKNMDIDMGSIIVNAERRRDLLAQIQSLIVMGAAQHTERLEELKSYWEDLKDLWGKLDREGRDLLPKEVRQVLSLNLTLHLFNLMGSTEHELPGFSDLAAFSTLPEPLTSGQAERGRGGAGVVGFNNDLALIEGWDLFDVDGRLQLQRIDDPAGHEALDYTMPKFASDAEAIIHVAMRATQGSMYHRNALELIGTLAE